MLSSIHRVLYKLLIGPYRTRFEAVVLAAAGAFLLLMAVGAISRDRLIAHRVYTAERIEGQYIPPLNLGAAKIKPSPTKGSKATAIGTPISTATPTPTPTSVATASPDALHNRILAELKIFTDWLTANNVKGYIGEFGWPDNSYGDAAQWNTLAAAWLRQAAAAGVWATFWAPSESCGDKGRLTRVYYKSDCQAPGIDSANTQAATLEADAVTTTAPRGVNLSWGCAGYPQPGSVTSSYSNVNSGVYGVDYTYASQTTFDFLSQRGFRIVRLCARWERLQPTLGGPLNTTAVQEIKDAVDRADRAGLQIVLLIGGNSGYYLYDGTQGVLHIIGSPEVTQAHFRDLWSRLSLTFKDNPTVIGYDLMNEPVGMQATYAPQITWYTWDDGAQGWVGSSSANTMVTQSGAYVRTGTGALEINKTMAAGTDYMLAHDNFDMVRIVTDGGLVLSTWVYLPPETPGHNWQARTYVTDANGAYVPGQYTPLKIGTWTEVRTYFTDLSAIKRMGIRVVGQDVNANVSIYIDDFQQGHGYTAAQVWERMSQDTLSAIRASGDVKLVFVPGYNWSGAQKWSTNHPKPWTPTPLTISAMKPTTTGITTIQATTSVGTRTRSWHPRKPAIKPGID